MQGVKKICIRCNVGCENICTGWHIGCENICMTCHAGCEDICMTCRVGCENICMGWHIGFENMCVRWYRVCEKNVYDVLRAWRCAGWSRCAACCPAWCCRSCCVLVVVPRMMSHVTYQYVTSHISESYQKVMSYMNEPRHVLIGWFRDAIFRTNYHVRDINKLSHGNFKSIESESQSKLPINQCAILVQIAQVWSSDRCSAGIV